MKPTYRFITEIVALTALVIALIALFSLFTGVRFNTTDSLPKGMYRAVQTPVVVGEIVVFCPPPSPLFSEAKQRGYLMLGDCEGGYLPLMKIVAAEQGDNVNITSEGVFINGSLWPNSAPQITDALGRTLDHAHVAKTLLENEVLLLTHSQTSFDSRYFGVIPKDSINGVLRPLLTFRN